MAEGYSQSARLKIMRGVPPKGFKKNFAVLKMNSVDARATTIVLDDSPGFWSVSAKDNIVPPSPLLTGMKLRRDACVYQFILPKYVQFVPHRMIIMKPK